jgi:hypothetical protein
MLGTVLWAKTVLAGVKASAVVLNRVLVAFIVCVQKIFFSWAPDFVDPSVSRNFENRNKYEKKRVNSSKIINEMIILN